MVVICTEMAAIELHRADMVSGMMYAPEVGGYVRIIIQYRDRGGGGGWCPPVQNHF